MHPSGSCIEPDGQWCENGEGCLINRYAEQMQAGDAFPSIEIVYDPDADGYQSIYAPWLVEGGYHRNSAWRTAGFTHAPAIVFAHSPERLGEARLLLLG